VAAPPSPAGTPARPGPEGTVAPTTTPIPSSPKGLSAPVRAGVALAVAAGLILLVLALGLVPGVSLFGAKGSNGESSAQALGPASGVARAEGAGALVLVSGVAPTSPFSFGVVQGNATCHVTGGLASNFTVPAIRGSYSSGDATLWIFVYRNSTGLSDSVVAVVGGSAYFLGKLTGTSCLGGTSLGALPATYVDSGTAASALDAEAGSFLSGHGSATAAYVLLNESTVGLTWFVVYTNCSYDPASHAFSGGRAADAIYGIVDGTNGILETDFPYTGVNCSALPTTNISLVSDSAPSTAGGAGTHGGSAAEVGAIALASADAGPLRSRP
jgi:hypothetical protein